MENVCVLGEDVTVKDEVVLNFDYILATLWRGFLKIHLSKSFA